MAYQVQTTHKTFREKYIGDKAFYRHVLGITIPIIIQNFITNFVGMLDNIMVGRIGTEQMSGVSIANQLIFVYFLCMFGGLGGIGIFTAQYYGSGDDEGIRHTFRAKLWLIIVLSVIAVLVLLNFGPSLLQLFLNDENAEASMAATLRYGTEYMRIILLSFPAIAVLQTYASTLRGCGETRMPMIAGVCAVIVNLVFNYLLIFGKLGFPVLGVKGAAIATVLSRYVEASICAVYVHTHSEKHSWIKGMYRTMRVPVAEVKRYISKGTLLLVNESLWSVGMTTLTQCYSMRGLNIIVAFNIANTLTQLLNVVLFAMGDAVAIIIGQLLGANKLDEAKDTDNKIIAFGLAFSLVSMVLLLILGRYFPLIYNTNDEARAMATQVMTVHAFFAPILAFTHCAYFTLRTGGKTFVTFLFDSAFTWAISVPIAFCLSRFTAMPAISMYICVTCADLIKALIGFFLVRSNIWIVNLAERSETT